MSKIMASSSFVTKPGISGPTTHLLTYWLASNANADFDEQNRIGDSFLVISGAFLDPNVFLC